MDKRNGFASSNRFHVVLIPGFGGFDALGQVEYYAGVTSLFHRWARRNSVPAVLHYFDNLPTAGVHTRARRLCAYLAKRIVRGEILKDDKVVLVGHSTGGLDIRQLVWDLERHCDDRVYADGGAFVLGNAIRRCLDAVVFLSVPHWGTNIADWVHSHAEWRSAVVAQLRAAVTGSQVYLVDRIEDRIVGGIAFLTDADLLLAMKDALTEANEDYGEPGPSRTADAQEAESELALYLRHMSSDFSVIDDLTSRLYDAERKTPAHFDDGEREKEAKWWHNPPIRTLSFATIGCRPFRFRPGSTAPVWELTNPCTYPEVAKDVDLSADTDLCYRLCYRACAGGPFRGPSHARKPTRVLGQPAPGRIELWDNDGIVNTASMFWPEGDVVLVVADHLDIVGHYKLVEVPRDEAGAGKQPPARKYRSYDSLKSAPRFTDALFEEVWTEVFEFSINARAPRGRYAAAGSR